MGLGCASRLNLPHVGFAESSSESFTGFHGQNDFSFRPGTLAFQHEMSLACVRERQDDAHPCSSIPAVDQIAEFCQAPGCDFDQEEGRIDAVALCKLLIGLGHGRDQLAAAAQDLERAVLRFAADEIKDGVHIPGRVLETLGPKINHRVRPELAHIGEIVRRLPSRSIGCRHGGNLHRVSANVPSAPWIRTVWPAVSCAWSNSPCQAVTAMTGTEAASMWLSEAGFLAIIAAEARAYSA